MGKVRIIGGRWKRRLLTVADREELRPTPDRVRETLFNWLAPHVQGARCLDLFAGSGALGFEAASRGASEVVLVEHSPPVARRLREQARVLGADAVRIVQADALGWLRGPARSKPHRTFDIVFVDPPFGGELLSPACRALDDGGWLAPDALVYLESNAADPPPLPEGWRHVRHARAGAVRYYLVAVSGSGRKALEPRDSGPRGSAPAGSGRDASGDPENGGAGRERGLSQSDAARAMRPGRSRLRQRRETEHELWRPPQSTPALSTR